MDSCVKIIQGKSQHVPSSGLMSFAGFDTRGEVLKLQDQKLKIRALNVLVTIVSSLLEWTKDLSPDLKYLLITEEKSEIKETNEESWIDDLPIILTKRPLKQMKINKVYDLKNNFRCLFQLLGLNLGDLMKQPLLD